jgi:hypothetical protein
MMPVTNQTVTLKAVTTTTVTLLNGTVWTFNATNPRATVAGVAVAPGALAAGMSCVLNGYKASYNGQIYSYIITSLACK